MTEATCERDSAALREAYSALREVARLAGQIMFPSDAEGARSAILDVTRPFGNFELPDLTANMPELPLLADGGFTNDRARLTKLIVQTLTDEDGAGSDLGPTEYDEPWLTIFEPHRALDVHHIVSDMLIWTRDVRAESFTQGQKSGARHADRLIAADSIGRPDLPGPISKNPHERAKLIEQIAIIIADTSRTHWKSQASKWQQSYLAKARNVVEFIEKSARA